MKCHLIQVQFSSGNLHSTEKFPPAPRTENSLIVGSPFPAMYSARTEAAKLWGRKNREERQTGKSGGAPRQGALGGRGGCLVDG